LLVPQYHDTIEAVRETPVANKTTATEDNEVRPFSVRLPKEQHDALRALAFFTDTSMNELIVQAIGLYLSSEGRKKQFAAMLKKAQSDYRAVLDKLATL
jgi:hypothetical protein